MQTPFEFDVEQLIREWEAELLANPVLTNRDRHDLRTNLLDRIDDYRGQGLGDEDAFVLARHHMGETKNWNKEFKTENFTYIQNKKAMGFTGGILLYFLLYYLILVVDKTTLLLCSQLGLSIQTIYQVNNIFLQLAGLLAIGGMASLVFQEKRFMRLIGRITLKPRKAFFVFVGTVLLAFGDRMLHMVIKGVLKQDLSILEKTLRTFMSFEYLFPLVFCLGFIFIYQRYYKKTKNNV